MEAVEAREKTSHAPDRPAMAEVGHKSQISIAEFVTALMRLAGGGRRARFHS
jgi:hypothetical protein